MYKKFFPHGCHRFRTRVRKSKTRKSKIGKRAHEKKKKNAQKKKKKRTFEKPDARKKKRAFFFFFFKRAFEKPPHVNMRLPLFRTRAFFFRFSNARFFSRFFRTRVFSRFFQTRVFFFVFQTRTRKRPKNANARSKPMGCWKKKIFFRW